jgi:hypothetical protein
LQEIDAELVTLSSESTLKKISSWLGALAVAHRATLRSLRLGGPLDLAVVFEAIEPVAHEFRKLTSVFLARGGDAWQPTAAARVLGLLPALARLQFRFSFGEEAPPQDLLSVLLAPQPRQLSAAAPPAVALLPSLRQLEHLSLVYPIRNVVPPTERLPAALSELTQVRASPACLRVAAAVGPWAMLATCC